MRRKRRSPAPFFKQPAPFNPVTGQFAMLGQGVDLTRVALMQVLEEHDDYLICRGFDPESKRFYNEIPVAKPYLLQRTPWDGRTVTLPEETVKYSYTEPDEPEAGEVAVARERTESYSTSGTFTVKIEPPYFVGDILVCAKPRGRLGDSPGSPAGADEGVDELDRVIEIMRAEPDANRLQKVVEWVDLNVGARRWGVVQTGRHFVTNAPHTRGGTVSVRWWDQDPDTRKATIDTGEDFDALDPFEWWPDAPAGTKGHAYFDGVKWIIDDMDCET